MYAVAAQSTSTPGDICNGNAPVVNFCVSLRDTSTCGRPNKASSFCGKQLSLGVFCDNIDLTQLAFLYKRDVVHRRSPFEYPLHGFKILKPAVHD